jgi:hypothetical protein
MLLRLKMINPRLQNILRTSQPKCAIILTGTSSRLPRTRAPDLLPEDRKSKFNIRKNNYLKGQRKNVKHNDNSWDSKDEKRATKTYIKSARKLLKRRYKTNHSGEPDYSLDQNTVINLAYFNYAKAHKLKV